MPDANRSYFIRLWRSDRVVNGSSPKEIAAALGCSIQAVYAHLTGVGMKTKCVCYKEIVAKLFQFSCHGLGHAVRFEVGG
jgi:hypothetical protein